MRYGVTALLVVGIICLVGCFDDTHQRRVDELMEHNRSLTLEMEGLAKKAKDGLASPAEIAAGMARIQEALKKNLETIQELQKGGTSTAAIIGGLFGTFGRTILHGATAIPTGNPILMALQGLLTFLLGGSSTKKPTAATQPSQ